MVRRASILAAALVVFPAIALAQEPSGGQAGTHTVALGETLWDLARTYYGNPFDWRRIYEANNDRINNPHWIYPGQELVIPGAEPARVTDVQLRDQPARAPQGSAMCPDLGQRTVFYQHEGEAPADECAVANPEARTIFYQAEDRLRTTVLETDRRPWMAVPRDIFYSAGWLASEVEDVDQVGTIHAFDSPETDISTRTTARPYERVRIKVIGNPGQLRVGELLQSYRVERAIRRLGELVMIPTGLLTVAEVADSGIVAVVSNEYDRVGLGNRVRVAPGFPLEPGFEAQPVMDGPRGMIRAVQRSHELQQPGDVVFLNLGSADGLALGDEFTVVLDDEEGWEAPVGGRLQVVGVRERSASARIIRVQAPVFNPGVTVRLDARLP